MDTTEYTENIDSLAASVRQKPFDAELRRTLIKAHLEAGNWHEAAVALNEKNHHCGLKLADGNLVLRLFLAVRSHSWTGAAFEQFLAHPFVYEQTKDFDMPPPTESAAVCASADKLLQCGLHDAARDLLMQALAHAPEHGQLHLKLIHCLVDQGDFAAAAAAANRKRAGCGWREGDMGLLVRLYSSLRAEGLRGEEVERFLAQETVRQAVATNTRYGQFESLGDDCELGFVQRNLGQEPLGLLRFASLPLATLIKLLNNGFAGFALAENCTLRVEPMGLKTQYDLLDRAYQYQIHTFIVADKTSEMATVLAKFCIRAQFLKRKLLDDLRTGEKIFVYKARAISLKDIDRLSKALRRHGPNRLLVVQERRRSTEAAGPRAEKWNDYLMRGYLERFETHPSPAHLAEWKMLLDAALDQLPVPPRRSWIGALMARSMLRMRRLGA
jgi:hypothetical protein